MDRSEYFREVQKANAKKPADDSPNQKFKRGSKVRIAKDLGGGMSHFPNDCDAIVKYTYKQKFGSGDHDNYSLILLKGGIPINNVSWYHENQLTLLDDNLIAGLEIILEYELKGE